MRDEIIFSYYVSNLISTNSYALTWLNSISVGDFLYRMGGGRGSLLDCPPILFLCDFDIVLECSKIIKLPLENSFE